MIQKRTHRVEYISDSIYKKILNAHAIDEYHRDDENKFYTRQFLATRRFFVSQKHLKIIRCFWTAAKVIEDY
jgi:hypothetical protein